MLSLLLMFIEITLIFTQNTLPIRFGTFHIIKDYFNYKWVLLHRVLSK